MDEFFNGEDLKKKKRLLNLAINKLKSRPDLSVLVSRPEEELLFAAKACSDNPDTKVIVYEDFSFAGGDVLISAQGTALIFFRTENETGQIRFSGYLERVISDPNLQSEAVGELFEKRSFPHYLFPEGMPGPDCKTIYIFSHCSQLSEALNPERFLKFTDSEPLKAHEDQPFCLVYGNKTVNRKAEAEAWWRKSSDN